MRDRAAASKYAKALFELASALKTEVKIEEELRQFVDETQSKKELTQFFKNPIISFEEKKGLLENVMKGEIENLALRFILIVLEKGRFEMLGQILDCYHELLNESKHFEEVVITTAKPLGKNLQSQLEKILEKKIGEKIISKMKIDPALLGGVSVQIRHRLFDGSIRSKLDSLKQQMIGA